MESQITILDGAMGTLLCDTTSPEASTSPLWSSADLLQSSGRLTDIHKMYLTAGADILSTATYQLSRDSLLRAGVTEEEKVKETHAVGMSLALEAMHGYDVQAQGTGIARSPGSVALSLGPFGAFLQPSQEYSGIYPTPYDKGGANAVESLRDWHYKRLHMFKTASPTAFEGMQILAFETVPWKRVDEIKAIRQVIDSEENRSKKAWISMVYAEEPSDEDVKHIVKEVFQDMPPGSAPRGIGINCTKLTLARDIARIYSDTVKELGLPQKDIFLVIYPDGGMTYDVNTKTWEYVDGVAEAEKWSDLMANIAREEAEKGCWESIIVGGCCKTTPRHIYRLVQKTSTS
ncbi:hypothetical protein H072_430 [Dactylellina haptotyla CBS 200.50]|uniref:Hcy-binding domain-containing protein n=1 Tax=Dactylellina haptotyla (strain CBS 200.50) TaxID=1284197 RepID=S8C1F2_DACHA|nr:hypothetical protein H072_430 [Dactylellina haptotyla CBS 200.50]